MTARSTNRSLRSTSSLARLMQTPISFPSPVSRPRFPAGQGGWYETCAGILGLTKMDWNNNALHKKLPVTLVYSKAFADTIKQNPEMVDSVFDFRNFM